MYVELLSTIKFSGQVVAFPLFSSRGIEEIFISQRLLLPVTERRRRRKRRVITSALRDPGTRLLGANRYADRIQPLPTL